MSGLPALVPQKTVSLAQWRQNLLAPSRSLAMEQSHLPFLCLVGFVLTQCFQIPLASLPVNWAVWPNLPDIFGAGLVLTVVLRCRHTETTSFSRDMLKDLVWMGLFFMANFVSITLSVSSTGEGIKYGGFALILFAKYIAVYWAVAHIPLDQKRARVLHIAALLALLWVVLIMLADRFYLVEIDDFTRHLPRTAAGKWAVPRQNSTVSVNPGGTTVFILILSALVLGSAHYRRTWPVEMLIFVLGIASCFISGSRQGLIRMGVFVMVYILKKPSKYLLLIMSLILLTLATQQMIDPYFLEDNIYYLQSVDRQQVLLTDPFSNEGLSGRPILWAKVIDKLDEDPIRWIIGYGIGNYVEYETASHNMVLRLIQDGGIIELVLVGFLWIRIFWRVWGVRQKGWSLVALTVGMLTSVFTSEIFYPTLATGWYLGLYFVSMRIVLGHSSYPSDDQCQKSTVRMSKSSSLFTK